MSDLSEQALKIDREHSVESLSNLAEGSKSPHLKRQLLKAACSLLEEELFSTNFVRLAKPSP